MTSKMLSVRSEHPLELITLAVIRELDNLASELKLTYFITGAMARDIMLTHVHGIETGIGTVDVDFAVAVASWEQFENIKARLVATGRFEAAERMAQRLYYKPYAERGEYWLDIVPFGGVERPPNTIEWPPNTEIVMNAVGYDEALAAAVQVQLEDGFVVPVTSLPGLALLKVFAWDDRGNANSKDARDLLTLFRQYAYAGNQDRLFGEAFDVLEAAGFDHDLAGPRLLGKDVRTIAARRTHSQIVSLLDDAKKSDRLVTHMVAAMPRVEDQVATVERLLAQFRAGLE